MCFGIFDVFYIEIILYLLFFRSIMPKPVYLMTVWESHQKYNSLIDQISAKYKQLDSGKFGAVGTPSFNAETCELAQQFAQMSELCGKLNLPMPKELHRPNSSTTEEHIFGSKLLWQAVRMGRMQLCSHRSVRSTRLLSAP